ncbi:hypothetical protein [Actinomadura physcomitrii]|uniref:hypothetical protein n=1 Tax=Actinomadura physcomitrii TaxID=2650748 RepID=UPI00192456E7|nr:hypothetical protein [Actinomadura physcomitrii]
MSEHSASDEAAHRQVFSRGAAIVPIKAPRGDGDEGITWTPDGARFAGLAPHLAAMLAATVDRTPHAEAIVDLGTGRRLDYAGLWEESRAVGPARRDGPDPP